MSLATKAFAGFGIGSLRGRVVVTDPTRLDAVVGAVRADLTAADTVVSFDDHDSELTRLNRTFGRTVSASPALVEQIEHAMWAAELTSGVVNPARTYTDWRAIEVDRSQVRLPDFMHLDLTATALAVALDRSASAVATRFGCGVLVSVGDHVTAAGPEPVSGWQITVRDGSGASTQIALPSGSAVVTSTGGESSVRTATVAASSALGAATLSRAAIRLGVDAAAWLAELGMPARLVNNRGAVSALAGWPADLAA